MGSQESENTIIRIKALSSIALQPKSSIDKDPATARPRLETFSRRFTTSCPLVEVIPACSMTNPAYELIFLLPSSLSSNIQNNDDGKTLEVRQR